MPSKTFRVLFPIQKMHKRNNLYYFLSTSIVILAFHFDITCLSENIL